MTVSSELDAQHQQAYIADYSLTIVVIALFCLLPALVIFRGIRSVLIYPPEVSPLNDESAEEEPNTEVGFPDEEVYVTLS